MSALTVPQSFLHIIAAFDIVIVYLLTYRLLIWLKRSQVFNLVKGIFLFFLVFLLSYLVGMSTLNWILERITTVLLILVVVIFQPEIRRFLERVGATGHLFSPFFVASSSQNTGVIKHILKAVDLLSKEKIGAILAIELSSNLSQYIDTGVKINGEITADLILSLFWNGSPTHDGALIIRADKVVAAGSMLPLSQSNIADRRLGTRHRAGLGLSEQTDAVIIVVSEESGVISLIEDGVMTRYLNREALETRLFNLYN